MNLIEETSLSEAWCKALENLLNHSGHELSPLVITITQFNENPEVKEVLNFDLVSRRLNSIDTVSETIFPNSLYEFLDKDRRALYKTYINNIPRIKGVDKRNRRGTYFERLIAFGEDKKVNQLEIIISSLQKGAKVRRRSKLQASTFNPLTDHTTGMFQGFPCLQHVTCFKSEKGGLVLNGFYAVQYLYQKAYGNWLGLINLGKFIAKESELEFEQFNCFIGVEELDKLTKQNAQILLNKLNSVRKL